ncbi:MAG TPA: hypothetical protein DDW52_05115 [Planctomycetaceae bacterium]|nr:hypothetical protein [Planctomycetaceae bacterium]
MNQKWKLTLAFAGFVAGASTSIAAELEKKFIDSGFMRRMGGYRPIRAQMDKDETIAKVAPMDLEAPKFGKLSLGDQTWGFIVDESEDGHKLYIDTNDDGDFTNDPEADWSEREVGELRQWQGTGKIQLDDERIGSIGLYRFDPNDKRRESLAETVLFYTDFGWELQFELDGEKFDTVLGNDIQEGTSLPIDRNNDGDISRNYEMVEVGAPFNFTGTTYLLKLTEGELELIKSKDELEQMPLPPDLSVGQPALEFVAETMSGAKVNFPSDFKGQIVMLDCWATWCGPCIRELPNMKKAYADWNSEGYEILGVSFDQASMEEKIQEFRKERDLPWPQIYSGKGWDTPIGRQYDVSGIPFVLLVDGDTGKIIEIERNLRGEGLSEVIRKHLEEKTGKTFKKAEEESVRIADEEDAPEESGEDGSQN